MAVGPYHNLPNELKIQYNKGCEYFLSNPINFMHALTYFSEVQTRGIVVAHFLSRSFVYYEAYLNTKRNFQLTAHECKHNVRRQTRYKTT